MVDVNSGLKVYRRASLAPLRLRATGGMFDAEVLARARNAGAHIVSVPVRHLPRAAGMASGARPAVIARAIRELLALYAELRGAPSSPTNSAAP